MLWLTYLGLIMFLGPNLALSNVCILEKGRRVKNLATKTPYAFLLEDITKNDQLDNDNGTCQPQQIWLLARHGTRYPSDSGLDAIKVRLPVLLESIKANHNEGRGDLCPEDLKALSDWVLRTGEDLQAEHIKEKFLHPEGELELILLAERILARFPDLLPEVYSPENFKFRATKTERAIRSQFFFATGLFDRKVAQSKIRFEEPIKPHDSLIRFYKTCPKWLNEVKKSPESLAEQRKFETSELFNSRLVTQISSRLGFDRNLSLSEIESLYVSCTFGQAWHPAKEVPVCQIFNADELNIFEFREDLEYFWQDGYGFEINFEPGCVLMKDIVDSFDHVVQGSTTKGIFYFTHSGAILKFLAFLGLYRDASPLLAENFDVMKDDRKWRTSRIDAFGSNVAFVLKKCKSSDPKDDLFKVGLLHNERLIPIPGCQGLWCDFKELKDIFEKRIATCDFEKLCATNVTNFDENAAADDRF